MHDRSEASGLQIAFLTLAINLMSIPVGKWIIEALDAAWARDVMPRILTLLSGAIVIAAFPAARHRALAYLRQPIAAARHTEVLVAAAAGVLIPFAVVGAMTAWSLAAHGFGVLASGTGSQQWADGQLGRSFSKDGLLLLFAAVVIAPLVEELVFRGFLFDAWQRRWGWHVSALLTSTVFGLYHALFLNAFLASIVFICVLRRSGSLLAPIIVHAFGNLALWYPVLGRFVFPQATAGGNAWIAWVPHMVAVATLLVVLPAYIFLASKKPAPRSAAPVPENEIPA